MLLETLLQLKVIEIDATYLGTHRGITEYIVHHANKSYRLVYTDNDLSSPIDIMELQKHGENRERASV